MKSLYEVRFQYRWVKKTVHWDMYNRQQSKIHKAGKWDDDECLVIAGSEEEVHKVIQDCLSHQPRIAAKLRRQKVDKRNVEIDLKFLAVEKIG